MSYFITHTGEKISIGELSIDQVHIEDIAHHLTNIQRYNGAIGFDKSYSVAQHCINVALYIYGETKDIGWAKAALLHDAAETYLGDLISGVKEELCDYKKLEKDVEKVINTKFKITPWSQVAIKFVDHRILLDEAKAIFPQYYTAFSDQYPDLEPLGISINTQHSKQEVKNKFLQLCKLFRIIKE